MCYIARVAINVPLILPRDGVDAPLLVNGRSGDALDDDGIARATSNAGTDGFDPLPLLLLPLLFVIDPPDDEDEFAAVTGVLLPSSAFNPVRLRGAGRALPATTGASMDWTAPRSLPLLVPDRAV